MTDVGGEESFLDHAGVKGMKWGVRKTPAERAASNKQKEKKQAEKAHFKRQSKLTAGEVVVSALVAGPVGVLTYKAIKRHAAKVKKNNSDLSDDAQTAEAKKLKIGEAVAVTILTSPVGLITYAAAKTAAANQVESF